MAVSAKQEVSGVLRPFKPVLMQEYGAEDTQLEAARKEMHRINTEMGLYK
ncbi:hypothetical protein ACF2G4_18710 (plasmid) [Pantoea sp. C3]